MQRRELFVLSALGLLLVLIVLLVLHFRGEGKAGAKGGADASILSMELRKAPNLCLETSQCEEGYTCSAGVCSRECDKCCLESTMSSGGGDKCMQYWEENLDSLVRKVHLASSTSSTTCEDVHPYFELKAHDQTCNMTLSNRCASSCG